MMWQTLCGMYFRLAGEYLALSPLSYQRSPIVRSANQRATIPDPAEQWKAFAADHGVTPAIAGQMPVPPVVAPIEPIVHSLAPPVFPVTT